MSFISKQLYPIPFSGGLDTKTDPKQVLAGKLLDLQNGLFNNIGQLNKRSGYETLSPNISGGTKQISAAQAIHSYDDQLLLFDGLNVYSYIAETQTWADKGIAGSVITTDKQIIRTNQAQQLNPDHCFCNNIEVSVWEDSRINSGSLRYSVIDTVTQSIIVSDSILSNAVTTSYNKPKTVTNNGQIYIFYTDGSNNIFYQTINPQNPTKISSVVNIVEDGYVLAGAGTFSYDVSLIGNKIFCAYLGADDNTGIANINLINIDPSGFISPVIKVATGSTAFVSATDISVINVVGDSLSNVWVTWSTGAAVNTAGYQYNLVQFLTPTLVASVVSNTITGIESQTVGTLQLIIEVSANLSYNQKLQSYTVSPTGTITSIGTLRSVGLASKAYTYNNEIYVNAAYQTDMNSTYFTILMTDQPFTVVGKVDSGTGGGLRTNNMLPEVSIVSPGVFRFINLTKGVIISEAATAFTLLGVNLTTLNYNSANQFQAVTQNNNLIIVGGILQIYDGISVVENNFHVMPENITTSLVGSGSGLATGQYQYQVTYEWMDNFGQIEISSPSPIMTIDVTAGQNVQLVIPTLRLTKKQGARTDPTICVYRTSADGTNFNEVTSILAPLKNNPNVDTVTFTDSLSDLSAASNRFLYTTGGVLINICAPASSLITLYQNRVILSGLEDPNLIMFSQNKQDYTNYNTTPTNFAAELTIGCNPDGGPITAIKSLNQNLVIFKRTNIFIVNGDGPNNTGGGNSYPNPQLLTSDVGCTNQNSIEIIPPTANVNGGEIGGLIFQSDKGIFLLDQSLNVKYIGAPVYSFNDLTITSATLVSDQNQVIFTTSSGLSLVYDYYIDQWTTFTNQNAIDGVIFQHLFTYVNIHGIVYQNNPDIFTDGGAPIYMSWTSPNFKFGQISGFSRVFHCMILGTFKGPHTLNVQVAYDDSPLYTENTTITLPNDPGFWGSDTVWGSSSPWGGVFTPYQFRIDFKKQKCTSIRLKITDNQTSNYNEGYAISAITFEVGVLPGLNKVPATQTFGTS